MRKPEFRGCAPQCEVTQGQPRRTGKRATGVTYVDAQGEEWEQPAELVLLCAFVLYNVRLLLLSGIGKPYDPRPARAWSGATSLPDHLAASTSSSTTRSFNPFIGAGRARHVHRRLQRRQFRPRPAWLHRRRLHRRGAAPTAGRSRPPDAARARRDGARSGRRRWPKNYLSSAANVGTHGAVMSYRGNYLDLDPDLPDALRPAAAADDVRLHTTTSIKMSRLPDRPRGRDRQGDGRRARSR